MKPAAERIAKGLWWDRPWKLTEGCSPVSEGCQNCWSAREAHMRAGQKNEKIRAQYEGLTTQEGKWNGTIRLMEKNLDLPLRVKKPQVWAVWNDLFAAPYEFFCKAITVMALRPDHLFLILTKRVDIMAECFARLTWKQLANCALEMGHEWILGDYNVKKALWACEQVFSLPLPNVWLGATTENQELADKQIPILLQVPAAVRFVSVEPMLGPVDLHVHGVDTTCRCPGCIDLAQSSPDMWQAQRIDWVICGGESGPGARPIHPDWARSLRDQCVAAGTPYFFKQWGEWREAERDELPETRHADNFKDFRLLCSKGWNWSSISADAMLNHQEHNYPDHYIDGKPICHPIAVRRVGKKAAGRLLDGRVWDVFPEVS